VFEELFFLQLALAQRRRGVRSEAGIAFDVTRERLAEVARLLPFTLTASQRKVLGEVARDMARPEPMNRLLQGDVGSGKTAVAFAAMMLAVRSGYQAAIMAPTEILSEQHYRKFGEWLHPLGVRIVWLHGGLARADRKRAHEDIATGAAQIVVGTHALVQDAVEFARLGLAVVDEQHRFGVQQRLTLRRKGEGLLPHQLMMSATPIPRTLSMTYFADLDVSTIDELPPGRRPVKTRLVSAGRRAEVLARIRDACAEGQQAYWVCPVIEESREGEVQTAIDTHALLSRELKGLRVALLHGRLPAAEKAAVMDGFAKNDIHLLVCTTVIEVGVDVPNASLMVIESAERFGLSQLHQLRGRIGRASGKAARDSVCVLLFEEGISDQGRARLKVIYECADGFEIARKDLELRGPGEFLGERQSGAPLLRFADLERDIDLVEAARAGALELIRQDPGAAARHAERWLGAKHELTHA
jgi:ATP-dependent DNA helicase RecG